MQISELALRGSQRGKQRMADGIRDGKPASPGFDLALRRHRLLDAIQKVSARGVRQGL
jgi:hypothetical protein